MNVRKCFDLISLVGFSCGQVFWNLPKGSEEDGSTHKTGLIMAWPHGRPLSAAASCVGFNNAPWGVVRLL